MTIEQILLDFIEGRITDHRAYILCKQVDRSFDFDEWMQNEEEAE